MAARRCAGGNQKMAGLLSKDRIVASPTFSRWLVPPASIAIHLCIGSVYAWSIYNPALIRVIGVVTPAAGDWTLTETNRVFTVAIVFLGLSAALATTPRTLISAGLKMLQA